MYGEWQPDYDMIRERFRGIEFEKRWRHEIFNSLNPELRNILVLDDQIGVACSSTLVADIFTKGSHHRNLTVISLVQNVYNQGKWQRTISLNSHYSVDFLVTVGTPHIFAPWLTKYVQITGSGLLILFRMPPANVLDTWLWSNTLQHLNIIQSSPIYYLESS